MQDVQEKIQKVFSEMLIVKHDGIKLSEIFDQYREWVYENTHEHEKWERRNFVCEFEERDGTYYTHYTVKFNEEALKSYDKPEIEFGFLANEGDGKASISWLKLDGTIMEGSFRLGRLSKIQALLANLYYNKTEIILDFDDVDDSNHFDIDD